MASHRLRGTQRGKIVVLDSSAILTIFELSIDISSELQRLVGAYHVVVPQQVQQELHLLHENRGGKKKQQAKAALQYIQQYDVVDTPMDAADDAVFYLVDKHIGVAVTNDKELRKRIRSADLPVIYLRGKNRMELEGSLQ